MGLFLLYYDDFLFNLLSPYYMPVTAPDASVTCSLQTKKSSGKSPVTNKVRPGVWGLSVTELCEERLRPRRSHFSEEEVHGSPDRTSAQMRIRACSSSSGLLAVNTGDTLEPQNSPWGAFHTAGCLRHPWLLY